MSNDNPNLVSSRRAIEALRAGVPNQDAVRALGSNQPHIESRFREELQRLRKTGSGSGLLIEGGFGTGKSHLFVQLQTIALSEGFVCSKVVVSKETPLHDQMAMYRSASESATVADRRGFALTELAIRLNFRSTAYQQFYAWAHAEKSGLDPRFAASLFLFQRVQNDPELLDRIVRFWGGEKLGVSEFKQYLKACGESGTYRIASTTSRRLAPQHFEFTSRLFRAAGRIGWVILIDEVELIARYPMRQRARSYSEVARWIGQSGSGSYTGVLAVLALTDDFKAAVLHEKGDLRTLADRVRSYDQEDAAQLAREAERGMQIIDRGGSVLKAPDASTLKETEAHVREIHGTAYGWSPPALRALPRLQSARIRQLLKSWITQWDLQKLSPSQRVDLEVDVLNPEYSEDAELAAPSVQEDE